MEILENKKKETQMINVGDIVKIHNSHYFIITHKNQFFAQNLNGHTRATSGCDTLEGLYDALVGYAGRKLSDNPEGVTFKIYSSNYYGLSIQSKLPDLEK